MNTNDWKNVLGAIAPTVASVLGGPLAGAAVGALSAALLGKPDGTVDEMSPLIAGASPDILLKIKQAEANLTTSLAAAGVQIEDINSRDRDSARKMAIDTKSTMTAGLAVAYTFAYFASLWIVWRYGLGAADSMEASRDLLQTLLGALSAVQLQIMNFYFGSSSSSKDKDRIIDRISGS